MQTCSDSSHIPTASTTVHVLCGSRYNAFPPTADDRDEACDFFRPGAWWPVHGEDPAERWDGLE